MPRQDYVKNMGKPYAHVVVPHSNDAAEAEAIITFATKDSSDVTGKAGAKLLTEAADAITSGPGAATARGTIPNFRAEAAAITKGTSGNFEKELENDPVMRVAGGKVPARDVGAAIIDEVMLHKSPTVFVQGSPAAGRWPAASRARRADSASEFPLRREK